MSVQFDLFLHSDDVIAENDLREAIRAGNADEAQRKLNELRMREPDHQALAPASVMIDALRTAHPQDSNAALVCLDRLEREWTLAAKTLFGADDKALLAPLWRVTGQALESMAFDSGHPDRHASRAYRECRDWSSVLRVTQAEPGFDNQPVLLERTAEALWQTGQTAQAIERWFTMCWSAPEYSERLIENEQIFAPLLLEHWNEAMNTEMEPALTMEWYPAWVMLHEPGLARSIKSRGADTGPERAFDLVRELLMSDDEQLALRRELKDIHPGLFDYFLHNKVQFLRG